LAEPKPTEEIQLVGGPGDGDRFTVGVDWTLLRWKPTDDFDRQRVRDFGIPIENEALHQFHYRRSTRDRRKFTYQP
jgi:hypothetical protein